MGLKDGRRVGGRRWFRDLTGRQELHRGLLGVQTFFQDFWPRLKLQPRQKICCFFCVFCVLCWSLQRNENMPLVAAEVDVRGTGWRSVIRSPRFLPQFTCSTFKEHDLLCHSVSGDPRVTGWCLGCPPSSCCPSPRCCRRRSRRRGASGSRRAPASSWARTPTCSRWGQTTGGAPPPPRADTADERTERNTEEVEGGILSECQEKNSRAKQRHFCSFSTEHVCHLSSPLRILFVPFPLVLPGEVCSFLWRTSRPTSSRPSPDDPGRNISASWEGTDVSVSSVPLCVCVCVCWFKKVCQSVCSLTSSYESSSRAPVPGFSPSWPNAPCCHESGDGEKRFRKPDSVARRKRQNETWLRRESGLAAAAASELTNNSKDLFLPGWTNCCYNYYVCVFVVVLLRVLVQERFRNTLRSSQRF